MLITSGPDTTRFSVTTLVGRLRMVAVSVATLDTTGNAESPSTTNQEASITDANDVCN